MRAFQNFIIVGIQRTGSSALAEALATHPEIACGWEWTENTSWPRKLTAAQRALSGDFRQLSQREREHIQAAVNGRTRWLGYRRLFGASDKWVFTPRFSAKLFVDRFTEHMNWFREQSDLRIIHLERTNHIDWLKSKYLSQALNSYVGGTYPDNISVRAPIRESVARVAAKIWIDKQLSTLIDSNHYLHIEYQDLYADIAGQTVRAAEFLSCAPDELDISTTSIKKQSNKSSEEYLDNYTELVEALVRHGFLESGDPAQREAELCK